MKTLCLYQVKIIYFDLGSKKDVVLDVFAEETFEAIVLAVHQFIDNVSSSGHILNAEIINNEPLRPDYFTKRMSNEKTVVRLE